MLLSSPRKRGCFRDVVDQRLVEGRSSPRKRGCFWVDSRKRSSGRVFPAQAGVFPEILGNAQTVVSLPRASGGVSTPMAKLESSPPVFPAQAGVFPALQRRMRYRSRLPRASGGVSMGSMRSFENASSSPRKRGCFCSGRHSDVL